MTGTQERCPARHVHLQRWRRTVRGGSREHGRHCPGSGLRAEESSLGQRPPAHPPDMQIGLHSQVPCPWARGSQQSLRTRSITGTEALSGRKTLSPAGTRSTTRGFSCHVSFTAPRAGS